MKFVISFFLFLFLFSCNTTTEHQKNSLPFLPNEASLILKIKDLKKAKSLLQNNSFLQQNKNNPLYQFFKNLKSFDLIPANIKDFYLCFSPLGKNDFGFTLIIDSNKTSFSITDLDKYHITDRSYNNFLYKEFEFEKQSLFGAQLNDTWVLSNDYLLMENHIKQFENAIPYKHPESFESLNNENISLIIVNSEIKDIIQRLVPNISKEHLLYKELSGWIAGDFLINKSTIDFNAIYKPNSNKDISAIFNGITPKNNRIAEITPSQANQFTSYSFETYDLLAKNLAIHNHSTLKSKDKTDEFLSEITEFGSIQLSKEAVFACRIPNESIDVSSYFSNEQNPELYRDTPIYKLDKIIDFGQKLTPLISSNKSQFYIQFREFIIFSNTTASLKELIPALKSDNTLYNKEWYKTFTQQLTAQSSMLTVVNTAFASQELKNTVAKNSQKKWGKTALKNHKAIAFQVVTEASFSHLHMVISKTIVKQKDFKVSETENVILPNNVQTKPQFTTNYITKSKDILVQDSKNQLLVISNKGEIKWKKSINEPILGEIKQMDMYRNGRLQYVFTTPTKLYVLNRNGKEVSPFPLTQKETITQPVAVFDYDNNRKYRIVVAKDSKLTMYDSKGKEVKGFKYKTNGTLTHAPKHIRVGKKDYIIVNELNNGVHFLNRTGKERIKLKGKPSETTQEWFWYKNTFSTLDINNSITQINTEGLITNTKPKLPIPDATAVTTTKTWVSFAENSLSIKDKIIELEFGKYTPPQIFYINNKIYVTITNMDTKKVFLFDSNAKSISGFPVFGTGEASIENIDKDTYLELIVKGDKNSILFYEFR